MSAPPLGPDEVQVWCLRTDRPSGRLDDLAGLLDDEDRERIARLVFPADRVLHQAAHGLLRLALSAATGRPPQAWRFRREKHAKPTLVPGLEGPAFNLTHTPGFAACALSWRGAVGIDAEHDRAGTAPLEVAPSVFTAAEQEVLAALSGRRQAQAFFDLWTLKEAVMKATGLGFALDPRGLDARLSPPLVTGAALSGDWAFATLQPSRAHRLSVALSGNAAAGRLRWRLLDGPWHDGLLSRARSG